MKVFIPKTTLYHQTIVLFENLGYEVVIQPHKADIIVFTGGEDINPAIYCQTPTPYTYFSSSRDRYEISLYNTYRDKLFVGICRGAQLLSALKGGELVQHINSPHLSRHPVKYGEETVLVNSLHHQAIISNSAMKVIMAEELPIIGVIHPENSDKEEEGMFYCVDMFTQENAFGVQFHPELMDFESRAVEIFGKEVRKFISERRQ